MGNQMHGYKSSVIFYSQLTLSHSEEAERIVDNRLALFFNMNYHSYMKHIDFDKPHKFFFEKQNHLGVKPPSDFFVTNFCLQKKTVSW